MSVDGLTHPPTYMYDMLDITHVTYHTLNTFIILEYIYQNIVYYTIIILDHIVLYTV